MNEQRLREELQRTPIDDGARARALRVALAAYEPVPPAPAPDAGPGRGLAAARRRCGRPVRERAGRRRGALGAVVFGEERPAARPALVRVPGGGRLLVTNPGAWVVSPDGSRRRLGSYAGASWSPNGLFVVVWSGGELRAVEPGGTVRWSLSRPGGITDARWAPVDGFRIAYLAGDTLRVVNGNGTGDRRLGPASVAAAPDWRPDDDHVLAYADRRRSVRVVAVDTGRELWRARTRHAVTELAWSRDGRRLLVGSNGSWQVRGREGRVLERRSLPVGLVADDFAWSPDGRLAVVRRNAQRSDVVLDGRVLFTGSGRFGDVAFSPDGRRLLVPWARVDQWVFVPTRPGGRPIAVGNIRRQFGAAPRQAPFPGRVEWITSSGRLPG